MVHVAVWQAHMVGSTTLGRSGKSWAMFPPKPSCFLLNGTGDHIMSQFKLNSIIPKHTRYPMNLQRLLDQKQESHGLITHGLHSNSEFVRTQNQMKYSSHNQINYRWNNHRNIVNIIRKWIGENQLHICALGKVKKITWTLSEKYIRQYSIWLKVWWFYQFTIELW